MAMRMLMLGLALVAAPAHPAPVHFVLSGTDDAYLQVARTAALALAPTTHSVGQIGDPVPEDAAIIVAVGTAAVTQAFDAQDSRPVVGTLVPASVWRALARDEVAAGRTAVFLDQPMRRHAALVRVLLPPVRDIGTVIGPTSLPMVEALQAAAAQHQLRVHTADAATADAVNGAVLAVLRRSEVLVALPDPEIFNRYTVQSVLLGTFRLRRPVIGFSESWVRAGALGAVHTTTEQLGAEVGELVARWLEHGGDLPPARYPVAYTLSVNRQVAVSLGIHLPADAVLQQQFQALEPPP